jgi:hypothetical protein
MRRNRFESKLILKFKFTQVNSFQNLLENRQTKVENLVVSSDDLALAIVTLRSVLIVVTKSCALNQLVIFGFLESTLWKAFVHVFPDQVHDAKNKIKD